MTSFIAACGSGRATSFIPAVPAAWSVTTIAFIAIASSVTWSCCSSLEALFEGCGQHLVIGVDDEDSEQLRRLGAARIAADRMGRVRRFGPALACPIDARLAVIHLRLDRARNHIGVDEGRLRVGV